MYIRCVTFRCVLFSGRGAVPKIRPRLFCTIRFTCFTCLLSLVTATEPQRNLKRNYLLRAIPTPEK